MSAYRLSHLSDPILLRDLTAHVARGRANTAIVLAHIAEVDARRLYLPQAHPSMFSYCVHVLHFSEDAAYKRIQAARAARAFPAIFDAVAEGRLHLTAVNLLAPHLGADNVHDLMAAATHRTKSQIDELLAERFPRLDVPTLVQPAALPSAPAAMTAPNDAPSLDQLAPAQVKRDTVSPLSSVRVHLQVTIDRNTHDKLLHAHAMLGHRVSPGDFAAVIDRALDALIVKLEKRKLAATDTPRATLQRPRAEHGRQAPSRTSRHIHAHVRRAVWERDGGQCTFVAESGQHCPARTRLEFDHVLEVARGGRATVAGIRLRCRAHNQYTAECTFGAEFMKRKRDEARRTAAAHRSSPPACTGASSVTASSSANDGHPPLPMGPVPGTPPATEDDVVPWLRQLGFRAAEARDAAAFCSRIGDTTLEGRMRAALCYLRPRASRRGGWTEVPV